MRLGGDVRGRWSLGLVFIAGAVLPLAFAPIGWWPLAPLSLACLFHFGTGGEWRQRALHGWVYGLGQFGFGMYWIQVCVHQYGLPYYVFSVPVTMVFVAFLACFTAAAMALTLPRRRRQFSALSFAGVWVLTEWARGWMFTGLPWLAVGYSQVPDSPLRGFAPVIGVYGVSLAVLLVAVAVARSASQRSAVWAGVVAATCLLGQAVANVTWTQPVPGTGSIAVMLAQGNIPPSMKWRPEERDRTLLTYLDLTAPFADADLIIWPETAIPAFDVAVPELLDELDGWARDESLEMLIGIPMLGQEDGAYYNGVINLGGDRGSYKKRHLVPFGEYIPFYRALAPLLRFWKLPVGNFRPGAFDQTLLQAGGVPVGVSICYEDIFAREVVKSLPEAQLLVNVSNDAWFGDSIAPHQHQQIAQMRALESGRFLLRATNTGITSIIEPGGVVVGAIPQFVASTLQGSVQPYTGSTPFVAGRYHWVMLLAVVLATAGRLVPRPVSGNSMSPRGEPLQGDHQQGASDGQRHGQQDGIVD